MFETTTVYSPASAGWTALSHKAGLVLPMIAFWLKNHWQRAGGELVNVTKKNGVEPTSAVRLSGCAVINGGGGKTVSVAVSLV
ncbi:MAG TPA: hypothetical protein VG167_16670 [Verrucomicrobiae bacterium]|nr:hypothetical protein [Verrucomicrobiae bacterium]